MYKWNFDEISSGRYQGINDSGIEIFNSNTVKSLAREVIQNSLDARLDNDNPVRVTFNTYEIKVTELPGYQDQVDALKLCVKESMDRKDKKAVKVFKEMVSYISKETIPVLVISDYNTTGLTRINKRNGSFESLVKAEGYSYKTNNGSGGSFGIGKSAAFSASKLRTVYYNTKNEEGENGFQGVTILTSHKTKNSDNFRLAKGFFPKDAIVDNHDYFKTILKRNATGTDLIIPGFDFKTFEKLCINEVVNNFFMALEKEKLEVVINDNHINKSTYGNIINENYRAVLLNMIKTNKAERTEITKVHQFYQAIKENVYVKKIEMENEVDSISIYITTSRDNNMSNEMMGIRSNGMNVNSFRRFTTPLNFMGVVYIENPVFNEILQSMENPEHNSWSPDRHPTSKNAGSKIIDTIRKAIREVLDTVEKEVDTDDIKLKGVNDLFNIQEVKTDPTKIKFRQKVKTQRVQRYANFNYDTMYSVIEKVYGGLTPSEKKRLTAKDNFMLTDDKEIKRTFFNVQQNKYRLIFTPKKAGNYFIEFKHISLDSTEPFALSEIMSIQKPFKFDQQSSNGIVCYDLEKDETHEIEISSTKKFRCAVEVNIYYVKK